MRDTRIVMIISAVLAACGGGSSATPCTVDSDCALGAVCRAGTCMTGCNDERDCPQDKPICDRDGSGGCVACVEDRDCSVPGLACIAGECRLTCSGDAECNGGLCDPATHSCVACAETSDCTLGHLCLDGGCVAGCERDRDCPPETNACAPGDGDHGTCYECIDSCAGGKTCVAHHCTSQCTTNVQCPDGVCDTATGTCVQCLDDSPCALGTICDEQMCIAGCRADKDCPTTTPHCDLTMGAHGTCVVAPGGGGGGENDACTASSECQPGLRCMALGICLKTCTTTCPAPQACTPFQDIEGNPLSFCL